MLGWWSLHMSSEIHSTIDFYEKHPISAQLILSKLQAARGNLDNLRPEELFAHDQDHYGGLAASRLCRSRRDSHFCQILAA
jgi:hypothetical protein